MRLWKYFKGRYLTDRADSILVPAMILAPVLALLVGITVEIGKNGYVRSERINAIQDSATAAVKTVDTQGSLNWAVVDKVVNEYERLRFGELKYSSSKKALVEPGLDTAESKAFVGCLDNSKTGEKYPQYKITLLKERGDDPSSSDPSVSFTRTQPTKAALDARADLRLAPKTIYRGVKVEIVDQTPNFLMSIAGAPCQKFDLSASAVTFGTDRDAGKLPVIGAF